MDSSFIMFDQRCTSCRAELFAKGGFFPLGVDMSKSSKPGAKSGKSGPTEKDRAPYLALVTCDAFSSDSAFSADVLGVPALLPVVGRPAIAYCLEWLANSAVEEVVVAAGDGADEVQNWFRCVASLDSST